jgi:hypothetical protein
LSSDFQVLSLQIGSLDGAKQVHHGHGFLSSFCLDLLSGLDESISSVGVLSSEGWAMSLIIEFLKKAKGRIVWVDILTQTGLFEGKVEAFDDCHLLISSEKGFDLVAINQIADISLPKQAEIVCP